MTSSIIPAKQINAYHAKNIIGTDIIRKKMGEVLDCVYFKGDEYIIERKNKPLAALIPIEKYNSIKELARKLVLQDLSNVNQLALSDNEATLFANDIKHQIRKK